MALIVSKLDSSSNGYSIVNKNYLEAYGRGYVKCATCDISSPSANSSYRITHNLGTRNIVLNAYGISGEQVAVEIEHSVPNENTVIVTFSKFDTSSIGTIRIVVMGALTSVSVSAEKIDN